MQLSMLLLLSCTYNHLLSPLLLNSFGAASVCSQALCRCAACFGRLLKKKTKMLYVQVGTPWKKMEIPIFNYRQYVRVQSTYRTEFTFHKQYEQYEYSSNLLAETAESPILPPPPRTRYHVRVWCSHYVLVQTTPIRYSWYGYARMNHLRILPVYVSPPSFSVTAIIRTRTRTRMYVRTTRVVATP